MQGVGWGGLNTLDVQGFISHARKQDLFEEMFPSKPKAANGLRTMVAHWERVQNQRCSADRTKLFTLSAKEQGKERGGCQTFRVQGVNEDPSDTVSLF